MAEIGNVNEELVLNCSGSLKIRRGNDLIEFFDSYGNPNIKLKNVVKDGQPNYNSVDGIYFDGINAYIKSGNTIKTISQGQGGNAFLPEGTILLYKGVTNPTGWYFYPESTGIDGLIYISNKQYTGRASIELYEKGSITKSATVGDTYNLPFSEIAARYATTQADYNNISGELYFEVTGANGYNNYASLSDNDTKLTFSRFGYTKVIAKVDANSSHTAASYEYILQINKKTYNLQFLNPPQISITSNTWVHLLDYIDKPTLGNNDLLNSIQFYLNGQQVTEYMQFTTVGYNSVQAILPSTNQYEEARSGYLTFMVSDNTNGTTDYNGSDQSFDIFGNNPTPGTIRYMKTLTNTKPSNKSEFTTSVPSAQDAGTYYIWYTINDGDIDGPVVRTISPKIVSNPTIILSQSNYTYDGTAKTPTVIVKDGNHVILASEYTVGYSNNTNIGTATVTVTDVTGGNYVVNGSTTFTISSAPKASITAAPTAKTLTYNETAQDLVNAGTASNGTVYYKVTTSNTKPSDTSGFSSSIPTGTDAGTYYVWYYAKGDTGYDDGDISSSAVTVTIAQEEETIETSASITDDYITEYQSGGNSIDNDNVKVEIVNNSSNTLISGVVFNNLNSEDTWIYNDNGDVTLTLTDDINSGTTVEYNGGTLNNLDGKTPVPSSYPGFSAGNVHMTINADLNQDGFNDTLSGFADNVVQTTYSKGKCYTLTVSNNGITVSVGDNIQSGSYVTSDSKIKVKIKNNTESNLTLTGAIKFKNGNTDIVSTTFNNSSVTINSGSSSTEYEIDFGNNAVTNTPSLTSIELTTSSNETISIALTNATFNMGALYTINYGEVSSNAIFDELLGEFNNVLYGNDTTDNRRIKSNNKANVYNYLHDMFMIADSEYKKNISANDSLFNPELYTEPTNYRKTSSDSGYADGDNETYKTMQAWLMATCLAELVTTTSSQTNIQTELFNKAYSLGKQNIYTTTSVNNEQIVSSNCYGIKQDPMIARYVATMIYAFNHDSKETDINNCRQAFESKYITINSTLFDNYTDNRDLGTLWGYNRGTNIGYFVNGDDIFGTPAGPFENNNTKSGDLFYGGNHTYDKYWYDYNYKMDVAIDAKVREIYNMYDDNGTTTASTFTNQNSNLTPSERKKIKQAIVDASIVPGTQHFMWFGKKIIKFDSVINVNNVTINNRNTNLVLHKFVNCTSSDIPSDSNDVYEYVGPYYLGDVDSNLKNIWYTNSSGVNPVYDYESGDSLQGTMTSHMQFMRRIQNLADRHREFSYDKGYGRMRPLWNTDQGKSRGEIVSVGYSGSDPDVSQASTYNGLAKYYAQALLADSRIGDNGHDSIISDLDNKTFSISDDFPADPANSWPSGHASQTWAPAMYLCQMFGNNSNTWNMRKQIIKQSYRLGSLRSIARFHWNSDILFGRLYATMLLPILNATKTLFTNYNSLKTALIGSSNISAIDDSSYTEGGDTDTQSGFGFNITIDNSNMSEAISLNGEFILYLENPDSEGQDHGWQGAYNGSNTLVFSNSPVTINAGESQTFSVISSYYIADEDEDGVDEVHQTTISEGLDMQNGVPRNMCDGYTLRVSTYQQDSQSGVWDYGHRNNVKIYIAGAHNGDTVIIRDLSSNVTISNGTTLNFEVISTNGGGNGSNPPQSGNVADITS